MGLFKDLLGAAAPIVGNLIAPGIGGAIGGALGGALSGGSKQSGVQTTTSQQTLDPRMQAYLYGDDGKGGLLGGAMNLLNQPQSQGLQTATGTTENYLQNYSGADADAARFGAYGLLGGFNAPTTDAAQVGMAGPVGTYGAPVQWNTGESVQAPSQNRMDLSGSYDSFINGAPGANPYLTGAIGRGINQSNNAFGRMQEDSTRNLLEGILPSIRSNAILSGGLGGSRQGIAEGRALGDFARGQQRAISEFGQNNTDAAVTAQAGAYDADRNRALAATQGLGAQQYGVASQDAQMRQQANLANQQAGNDASRFGAQMSYNADLANKTMDNSTRQFNAGLEQQSNLANMNSQLSTNSLNTNRTQSGAGLLSGLMDTQYGRGLGQNNYDLNRTAAVSGILGPYANLGSTRTESSPLYQNKMGNILGGAMMGNQLFGGLFSGLGGGSSMIGGLQSQFPTY